MDNKRFLFALALSIAVIFVVQTFFAPKKTSVAGKYQDNTAVGTTTATSTANGTLSTPSSTSPSTVTSSNGALPNAGVGALPAAPAAPAPRELTTMAIRQDSGATFTVSNVGAMPVGAVMNAYENRAYKIGKVNLADTTHPLIKYQIVTNKQSVDLSTVPFTGTRLGDTLVYQATVNGSGITIRYVFLPDGHTVRVSGAVANTTVNTANNTANTAVDQQYLVVSMPTTFLPTEPDTTADQRAFAYVYDSKRDGSRSVGFSSIDPGERKFVEGPIRWLAAKSKYFVVGVIGLANTPDFTEASLEGGARTTKVATHGAATVTIPVTKGVFGFDLYAGPQEWRRLHVVGHDFEEVNPYGWAFLRGVLQPIATGAIRLVLWMHRRLALSYGLVLILLGVLVRIVLWPLNQSAMRTSLKMQTMQPDLQAVQNRYKDNPEKQRTAMMEVYKKHGMSPLSPVTGCLPMFLPMPVLFALFFVFQSTIELRGVSFGWVPDLSSPDPLYILPVLMAISMYVLSWMGMKSSPPNPQAKMMSYLFPVMFLFFMWRVAAGLNLYYAAQNLAALPQQWMLIRERAKMNPGPGSGPVTGVATKKVASTSTASRSKS